MTDGEKKCGGIWAVALVAALTGLFLAELCARYGWFVITLMDSTINRDLFRALRVPYVFIIPLSVVAVFVWREGAKRSLKPRWIAAISLAALIAVECAVRTKPVQQALWLAVKVRSTGWGDYFLRELAYLKLSNLDDRASDPRRIITIGTSQIIVGLNCDQLRKDFPAYSVCRRGIAGMVPLRMAAALDSFPVRSNDVVVMYLSDLDLIAIDRFNADWMRPVISPHGLRTVLKCLPMDDRRDGWRHMSDLFLAAHSELWRCRDAFRTLLANPVGKPEYAQPASGRAPAALAKAGRHPCQNDYWGANLKSLETVVGEFVSRGAKVVAFEGQVNPSGLTPDLLTQREDARREYTILFKRFGGVFVPLPEQPLVLTPADFKDGSHMTSDARDRFTKYVTGWLRDKTSKDWK